MAGLAREAPAVFVIVSEPIVRISGWVTADEAKAIGQRRKGDELWVPRHRLRPLSDLAPVKTSDTVVEADLTPFETDAPPQFVRTGVAA